MENMTQEEIRSFLMDSVRTGKLASVRADGRPHVTPIWYVFDGEYLFFNTWHESVKAKNILREGQVSICVDEEQPPFAFVIIEGNAEAIEVTAEERVAWATKIGGRYMGQDKAEQFGKRNGVEGELLIRVTPSKIIAKKNVSA